MSKRIVVTSPIVSEEKKLEVLKEINIQKQKDKKRWDAYKKYLSYLNRKRKRVVGGLNTTK